MYRIRFQLLFVVALVVVFSNSNAQTIYGAAIKPDNSDSSSILEARATGSGAGVPRLTKVKAESKEWLMVLLLQSKACKHSTLVPRISMTSNSYKVLDVLHATTAEIPIT